MATFNTSEFKDFKKAQHDIMAGEANHETLTETQKWLQWLDDNVDPKWQQRFKKRYEGLTESQRQQMTAWFEEHQEQMEKRIQMKKKHAKNW